jgi:ferredoxin-like protein FixX
MYKPVVEMDCEKLCSITAVSLTSTVRREGSKMTTMCPSVVYKVTNRRIILVYTGTCLTVAV